MSPSNTAAVLAMAQHRGLATGQSSFEESTNLYEARVRAATVNAIKRKPKRIVLIGSTKCGKSSLIRRFLENTYTEEYTASLEECYNYQYTYRGCVWNLDIIDLCGPFMFPVMRDLNIRTAHILLLVYEIGNSSSIEELSQVLDIVKKLRPRGLTMVVVGTKSDLMGVGGDESVECPDILRQKLGDEVRHVTTSAILNKGISEVFDGCLEDYSTHRPSSVPPPIEQAEFEMCGCGCTLL